MDANPPGRPPSPVKPSAKLTFKTDNVEGSGEVTFSLTRGQPLKITEKSKVTVSSRNKPVRPAPTPGSKPRPKVNIFYTIQKTIEYPLPADLTGESLNESKTKEPPAQNR